MQAKGEATYTGLLSRNINHAAIVEISTQIIGLLKYSFKIQDNMFNQPCHLVGTYIYITNIQM